MAKKDWKAECTQLRKDNKLLWVEIDRLRSIIMAYENTECVERKRKKEEIRLALLDLIRGD